jgi:hypothetical protein
MAGFLKQLAGAVGGGMVEQANITLDEQRQNRLAKLKTAAAVASEGRAETRAIGAEGRKEVSTIAAEGRKETRDVAAAEVQQEGAMELQKLKSQAARDNLKTGPKSKTEIKDDMGIVIRTILHNYDGTSTVVDHIEGTKQDFETWAAAKKKEKRNVKEDDTAAEWVDLLMPKGIIDAKTEDMIEEMFGGDDDAAKKAAQAAILKRIKAGQTFDEVHKAVLDGTLRGGIQQSAQAPKPEDDPMAKLPDPATKEGRTLTDPKSKRRFVSDGVTWKEV